MNQEHEVGAHHRHGTEDYVRVQLSIELFICHLFTLHEVKHKGCQVQNVEGYHQVDRDVRFRAILHKSHLQKL